MKGDDLFDSIPWIIWPAVECNIAIIAASVPSIIPLLKKFYALWKGKITNPQERSHNTMQDIEHGNQKHSRTENSAVRKGSMQQGLLIDGDSDLTRIDMIPKIQIEEDELSPLDSDDDKDISQIYLTDVCERITYHFEAF
jgi:hypothetical protein